MSVFYEFTKYKYQCVHCKWFELIQNDPKLLNEPMFFVKKKKKKTFHMVVHCFKLASAPLSKCIACNCNIRGASKQGRRKFGSKNGKEVPVSIREYLYYVRGISLNQHQKISVMGLA